LKTEPEIYLWGLKVNLDDSSKPALFSQLKSACDTFEKGITKYLTQPDIMLYVPGELLLLIEAKFTSGNPIALPGVINVNTLSDQCFCGRKTEDFRSFA